MIKYLLLTVVSLFSPVAWEVHDSLPAVCEAKAKKNIGLILKIELNRTFSYPKWDEVTDISISSITCHKVQPEPQWAEERP